MRVGNQGQGKDKLVITGTTSTTPPSAPHSPSKQSFGSNTSNSLENSPINSPDKTLHSKNGSPKSDGNNTSLSSLASAEDSSLSSPDVRRILSAVVVRRGEDEYKRTLPRRPRTLSVASTTSTGSDTSTGSTESKRTPSRARVVEIHDPNEDKAEARRERTLSVADQKDEVTREIVKYPTMKRRVEETTKRYFKLMFEGIESAENSEVKTILVEYLNDMDWNDIDAEIFIKKLNQLELSKKKTVVEYEGISKRLYLIVKNLEGSDEKSEEHSVRKKAIALLAEHGHENYKSYAKWKLGTLKDLNDVQVHPQGVIAQELNALRDLPLHGGIVDTSKLSQQNATVREHLENLKKICKEEKFNNLTAAIAIMDHCLFEVDDLELLKKIGGKAKGFREPAKENIELANEILLIIKKNKKYKDLSAHDGATMSCLMVKYICYFGSGMTTITITENQKVKKACDYLFEHIKILLKNVIEINGARQKLIQLACAIRLMKLLKNILPKADEKDRPQLQRSASEKEQEIIGLISSNLSSLEEIASIRDGIYIVELLNQQHIQLANHPQGVKSILEILADEKNSETVSAIFVSLTNPATNPLLQPSRNTVAAMLFENSAFLPTTLKCISELASKDPGKVSQFFKEFGILRIPPSDRRLIRQAMLEYAKLNPGKFLLTRQQLQDFIESQKEHLNSKELYLIAREVYRDRSSEIKGDKARTILRTISNEDLVAIIRSIKTTGGSPKNERHLDAALKSLFEREEEQLFEGGLVLDLFVSADLPLKHKIAEICKERLKGELTKISKGVAQFIVATYLMQRPEDEVTVGKSVDAVKFLGDIQWDMLRPEILAKSKWDERSVIRVLKHCAGETGEKCWAAILANTDVLEEEEVFTLNFNMLSTYLTQLFNPSNDDDKVDPPVASTALKILFNPEQKNALIEKFLGFAHTEQKAEEPQAKISMSVLDAILMNYTTQLEPEYLERLLDSYERTHTLESVRKAILNCLQDSEFLKSVLNSEKSNNFKLLWGKLSLKQQVEIIPAILGKLDGTPRAKLFSIFAQDEKLVKAYIDELRNKEKFYAAESKGTLDKAPSLFKGHLNTQDGKTLIELLSLLADVDMTPDELRNRFNDFLNAKDEQLHQYNQSIDEFFTIILNMTGKRAPKDWDANKVGLLVEKVLHLCAIAREVVVLKDEDNGYVDDNINKLETLKNYISNGSFDGYVDLVKFVLGADESQKVKKMLQTALQQFVDNNARADQYYKAHESYQKTKKEFVYLALVHPNIFKEEQQIQAIISDTGTEEFLAAIKVLVFNENRVKLEAIFTALASDANLQRIQDLSQQLTGNARKYFLILALQKHLLPKDLPRFAKEFFQAALDEASREAKQQDGILIANGTESVCYLEYLNGEQLGLVAQKVADFSSYLSTPTNYAFLIQLIKALFSNPHHLQHLTREQTKVILDKLRSSEGKIKKQQVTQEVKDSDSPRKKAPDTDAVSVMISLAIENISKLKNSSNVTNKQVYENCVRNLALLDPFSAIEAQKKVGNIPEAKKLFLQMLVLEKVGLKMVASLTRLAALATELTISPVELKACYDENPAIKKDLADFILLYWHEDKILNVQTLLEKQKCLILADCFKEAHLDELLQDKDANQIFIIDSAVFEIVFSNFKPKERSLVLKKLYDASSVATFNLLVKYFNLKSAQNNAEQKAESKETHVIQRKTPYDLLLLLGNCDKKTRENLLTDLCDKKNLDHDEIFRIVKESLVKEIDLVEERDLVNVVLWLLTQLDTTKSEEVISWYIQHFKNKYVFKGDADPRLSLLKLENSYQRLIHVLETDQRLLKSGNIKKLLVETAFENPYLLHAVCTSEPQKAVQLTPVERNQRVAEVKENVTQQTVKSIVVQEASSNSFDAETFSQGFKAAHRSILGVGQLAALISGFKKERGNLVFNEKYPIEKIKSHAIKALEHGIKHQQRIENQLKPNSQTASMWKKVVAGCVTGLLFIGLAIQQIYKAVANVIRPPVTPDTVWPSEFLKEEMEKEAASKMAFAAKPPLSYTKPRVKTETVVASGPATEKHGDSAAPTAGLPSKPVQPPKVCGGPVPSAAAHLKNGSNASFGKAAPASPVGSSQVGFDQQPGRRYVPHR